MEKIHSFFTSRNPLVKEAVPNRNFGEVKGVMEAVAKRCQIPKAFRGTPSSTGGLRRWNPCELAFSHPPWLGPGWGSWEGTRDGGRSDETERTKQEEGAVGAKASEVWARGP